MLINDFDSRLTEAGCLEFPIPAFGNTVGRITPWAAGFDSFEVKYHKVVKKPLWGLEILPRQDVHDTTTIAHHFLLDIPADIRARVRSFKFGQCAMLRWLARSPQARDLCHGNPKLLWLLATAVFDSNIDEAEVPQLLLQKQVDILGLIYRPASQSALRLLRKIELTSGDLGEARSVIRALKKPYVQQIVLHLHAVSTSLLSTLCENPDLALASVVRILAHEFRETGCRPNRLSANVSDTIADIRRMAEVLGIENPEQAIERCRSLGDLNRLHDRWVDRVNRGHGLMFEARGNNWLRDLGLADRLGLQGDELESLAAQDWSFPEPPFASDHNVKAIQSLAELLAEGRVQGNCAPGYAREIVAGEKYLYKVLSPHRATLELVKTKQGWQLGEFKLSQNRVPGAEMRRVVSLWFQQNSL